MWTAIALGATAAVQYFGARSQANAAKQAGAAQQAAAESDADRLEWNAEYARLTALDTIDRGAEEEAKFRSSVRGLIGSQRAGYAAQDVDVAFGSATDVQADAEFLGELDALTLRNNVQREAYGYTAQAEDLLMQADVTRKSGAAAARAGRAAGSAAYWTAATSILGTGLSLAASRYGTRTTRLPRTPDTTGDPLPGDPGRA